MSRVIQQSSSNSASGGDTTATVSLEALKASLPVAPALVAAPLMHGTGMAGALGALLDGAAVVTLTDSGLNAEELWTAVEKHGVGRISIVGDVFARPMLKELQDNPGKYDVSSVASMSSSGIMWSHEVKQGLIKEIPQIRLLEGWGSSEAVSLGTSVSAAGMETKTAKFQISAACKVFDENDHPVTPGSGTPGFIAMAGFLPLGYYKDEEKTAKTTAAQSIGRGDEEIPIRPLGSPRQHRQIHQARQ